MNISLSPLQWLIAAGLLAAVTGGIVLKIRHDGYQKAISDVQKQNERAKEASEERGIDVDACYALGAPWVWSVSKGGCIKP